MKRVAVVNVVGLCERVLGPHTPRLNAFRSNGELLHIQPAFPAVTCTAQSNYLTGQPPQHHGIVANGWYNRELAEVQFWKQSNHLVAAPKVWDSLRSARMQSKERFTCAKLFWWYNMYSSADYSITPRPMYPADGRKFFDIYTQPSSIRSEIKEDLGEFPFATFWGPAAGLSSPQGGPDAASKWIAQSAKWIEEKYQPNLNLIYLPHLDYNLQRFGPNSPLIASDYRMIDEITGDLIDFFKQRSVEVIILSEYGITEANTPVHLNRVFRDKGWIAIREELGLELLDCGASKAFAVADHQIAHIYINDPTIANDVRKTLESVPGVELVLDTEGKRRHQIDHPRAGDLIAVARENAWFTYYYWMDDACAPDFARCVDIHRKPGYDPVELFLDPNMASPKLRIAWRLLQKKLGFRMLMDVIPLDANLVKGSHGRATTDLKDMPLLLGSSEALGRSDEIDSTDVCEIIRRSCMV